MATDVVASLGLDKSDINNRLLLITERNDANSSFLLSSIISERYQKNSAFLIVTFNNTYKHYHNVGMKLGYNLDKLQNLHKLDTIEVLKHVYDCINDTPKCGSINFLSENKSEIIEHLTKLIHTKLINLFKVNAHVCLVIEDISCLLDLNIPLKDIVRFKQNLKDLLNTINNLSIIVSTSITNQQDLIISNMFRHNADSVIELTGLKTGKSDLVTGIMHVRRINEELKSWGAQNTYHYKLLDRQIRIFAPGTANTIV